MRCTNYSMVTRLFLCSAVMIAIVGCSGSDQSATDGDDHEHAAQEDAHAAPADFATGVTMLTEQYQAIKTAFEAGNADEAHDPLHEVGYTLEALPELAGSAELSDQQIKEVDDTVDQMFEAYTQIDSAMHKGEEPDYAAVAETLEKCMAKLEAVATK